MEEFRPSANVIARGVARVLKSRGESAITVGNFSGPANLGTAIGPGLRQLITEELKRAEVRVEKLGTNLALSGIYRFVKVNEFQPTKEVQLEVSLTDDSGAVVTDLASAVTLNQNDGPIVPFENNKGKIQITPSTTEAATAVAMGLTVDFDEVFRKSREEADSNPPVDFLDAAQRRPTAVVLKGTELRASRTSPYGLRIVVGGQPREIVLENGRPFVSLDKGETFRVVLVNSGPLAISEVLTLDGLSNFTFSTLRKGDGKPKYSQWILGAGMTGEVAGWHVDNSRVREFKITDFSQSAAALAGSEGSVGAITVVIRATWKVGAERPSDEPLEFRSVERGIGLGDEIDQKVQEDIDPREYGRIRAVLTIRYDKPDVLAAE